ncbi:MAG: hypothetical protein ABIJ20_01970 [Nanoarchaeota archaeon]|nr:hypothetical protein [Nanoarchaeota archaeon]MBU1445311.1 hypothetical protein [Nanoarchaeota archaeon]MBU2420507.1 hypothetical protein [Nanoarchaeota archaeon]MBU2475068.1 hypothetical protein [Nanoarchaeota archaeon]
MKILKKWWFWIVIIIILLAIIALFYYFDSKRIDKIYHETIKLTNEGNYEEAMELCQQTKWLEPSCQMYILKKKIENNETVTPYDCEKLEYKPLPFYMYYRVNQVKEILKWSEIACKIEVNKLGCNEACHEEGYNYGTCEEVLVIEKPCESIDKITLFSEEQLCESLETNLLGAGVACCCSN